jgi:hypothetical protein
MSKASTPKKHARGAHSNNSSQQNMVPSPGNDSNFDDNLEEMMVIDINFAKGRSDEIIVHFGDKPTDLAEVLQYLG